MSVLGGFRFTHTNTHTHKYMQSIHIFGSPTGLRVFINACGLWSVEVGMEPSGLVCLAHELAFTEVPTAALDHALRDGLTATGPDGAACFNWVKLFMRTWIEFLFPPRQFRMPNYFLAFLKSYAVEAVWCYSALTRTIGHRQPWSGSHSCNLSAGGLLPVSELLVIGSLL